MGRGFVVYVALNMTLCAIIFLPWALPRETISGFMGRYAANGHRVAKALAAVIDLAHWWEVGHCHDTYLAEEKAREALYP